MKDSVVIHDPQRGHWLAFDNPVRILSTQTPGDVLPLLRELETEVDRQGLYAAGFLSYEAAPSFDPALTVRDDPSGFPLLWFGLYKAPGERTSPGASPPRPHQAFAPHRPFLPHEAAGDKSHTKDSLSWVPSLTRDTYLATMARIRQYLFEGDTYQVNYSFRLTCPFQEDPQPLFENLVQAQGAHYAAFLETENFAICSASPELFFRLDGTHLESRPMKGTMKRGLTSGEDLRQAQTLRNSPKNQAENVMIVDMIRNDMGRVAEPGSVVVDRLFEVEKFPTVWQMVSTVSARTQAPLSGILSALFPCASITGAPKPRTMGIIASEETAPRRIYTGTIGYVAPGRQAQFNVAIRTVLIDKATQMAEYGVGGGIVWDSVSGDEYDECWIKAKVLTETQPEFQLLETLLWTADDGFFLLERHLKRLKESAEYFGFVISLEEVRRKLNAMINKEGRIRLLVGREGEIKVELTPLERSQAVQPVRVKLAAKPVDPADRFLYHKTTWRRTYEAARENVTECDDILLWNPSGELTESTIANLVVDWDGRLLTPPVSCGLLPGTFREELLAQGKIEERVIRIDDLAQLRKLYLVNSVRKWREAVLWR
ncbi:MAG: aminodeoxychorismate synthase component I [bacterium]